MNAPRATQWMERHQVALYITAISAGLLLGGGVPGSDRLDGAIEPVLMLLLFATFLAVPFRRIGTSLRDGRFLALLAVVNFVVAPVPVFGLSRFVASDEALLIGVLLVLLTPCIDYVITFTGLAGGEASRLVAAAPLLMVAQLLLLPVYLLLFMGPSAVDMIDVGPFVEAFALVIAVPLAAAAVVQGLSRRSAVARGVDAVMHVLMVPLLMATLAVVLASQVRGVGEQLGALLRVVPIFAAFVVVMVAVGVVVSRVAGLDAPAGRALTFSGVTRNSLVVLPLALALPASLALAPLVVVTQTVVELIAMVVLVRVLPRILPSRARVRRGSARDAAPR